MCGRFALHLSHEEIASQLNGDVREWTNENAHANEDEDDGETGEGIMHESNTEGGRDIEWIDRDAFKPRFNIAPHSMGVVLRASTSTSTSKYNTSTKCRHEQYILHTMKWGLVPPWAKFEDGSLQTINARVEAVESGKGLWSSERLRGRGRCVVIANGYYEWLTKGKTKTPYYFKFKQQSLMYIAALYSRTVLSSSPIPLYSFSIITRPASERLQWIHDREPVVLQSEQVGQWLSGDVWSEELITVLRGEVNRRLETKEDGETKEESNKDELEYYRVPQEVGRVGVESRTFVEPVEGRRDGIEAFFGKASPRKESGGAVISRTAGKTTGKRNAKEKHEDRGPPSDDDDEIVILDGPPHKKPKIS